MEPPVCKELWVKSGVAEKRWRKIDRQINVLCRQVDSAPGTILSQAAQAVRERAVSAASGETWYRSWAEFMANSRKIKDPGIPAVVQSFRTDWSAQIFVLADFYKGITAVPSFAADYTVTRRSTPRRLLHSRIFGTRRRIQASLTGLRLGDTR
jgi:hypothetical protein